MQKIMLRISAEQLDEVDQYASKNKISKQEAIRQIIDKGLNHFKDSDTGLTLDEVKAMHIKETRDLVRKIFDYTWDMSKSSYKNSYNDREAIKEKAQETMFEFLGYK